MGTTYTDLWVTALAYNAVNEDTRMWLETQLKFEIDPRAFSWIIIYSLVFLRGKIRHDTFVIYSYILSFGKYIDVTFDITASFQIEKLFIRSTRVLNGIIRVIRSFATIAPLIYHNVVLFPVVAGLEEHTPHDSLWNDIQSV